MFGCEGFAVKVISGQYGLCECGIGLLVFVINLNVVSPSGLSP